MVLYADFIKEYIGKMSHAVNDTRPTIIMSDLFGNHIVIHLQKTALLEANTNSEKNLL
jgi:hypothetical protein